MPDKELQKQAGILEALLFVYGEPMPMSKAAEVMNVSADNLEEIKNVLRGELLGDHRGLSLLETPSHLQLVTKSDISKLIEVLVDREFQEDLTPASVETLSIISYFGPIPRPKIEYLRGVNSQFTLRTLLLRGLIEKVPDPGRAGAYVYMPSMATLAHLGVNSAKDLPDYEKFQTILASWNQQTEPRTD